MCPGSNTTTTSTRPPKDVRKAYRQLMKRATKVADTKYTPYKGDLVADQTRLQRQGINQLGKAQDVWKPYVNQAKTYTARAANIAGRDPEIQKWLNPYGKEAAQYGKRQGAELADYARDVAARAPQFEEFNKATIDKYSSPYTKNVVDASLANIREEERRSQADLLDRSIMGGNAFGGDRAGVAASELARGQQLSRDQVVSGLYEKGYGQALGQYNQNQNMAMQGAQFGLAGQQAGAQLGMAGLAAGQQGYGQALGLAQGAQQFESQAQAQAAAQMAGLGSQALQSYLTSAGAAVQGGSLDQAQRQAELNSAYQQFQQQQAYPFQTTQFLANTLLGTGQAIGGTSTTTQPGPSPWATAAGLGMTGLGMIGGTGGFGAGGWLTALSDRRAKENREVVGKLFDGQPIYRYNFKGQPRTEIGLIAQNVERRNPEAVSEFGGLKMVDYGSATEDAARKGHFASGGLVPSGMPFEDQLDAMSLLRFPGDSTIKVKGLMGLPKPPSPRQDDPVGDIMKQSLSLGPMYKAMREDREARLASPLGPAASANRDFGSPIYARGGLVPHYALGGEIDDGEEFMPDLGLVPSDEPIRLADASGGMPGYSRAIANIESGGDYSKLGPIITGGDYAGDRAIGKYQIMGKNISPWTKEILGREMTPDQFLADKDAQDAVFNGKFGAYEKKYGPSGAARAWFAGEGGMNRPERRDQLGTSVAGYEEKFNRGMGFAPEEGGGGAPPAGPPLGLAPPPPSSAGLTPAAKHDNRDVWLALAAAGLGTLASKSPYASGAIGEGGLVGLKTYMEGEQERKKLELAQRKLDSDAQVITSGPTVMIRYASGQIINTGIPTQTAGQKEQAARSQAGMVPGTGTRIPQGFKLSENGGLIPIPGGPSDPVYKQQAAVRQNAPAGYRWVDPQNPNAGLEAIQGGPGEKITAEVAARLGLAKSFLGQLEDYPDREGKMQPGIRSRIQAGEVTGPIDGPMARLNIGKPGELRRQISSGAESLLRNLTGAGMNLQEAKNYVARYEPEWNDSAETLLSKVGQLERELKSTMEMVAKGRGGTGPTAPVPPPASRGISKEQYDALPPGSSYTAPDGVMRVKR
jgi:hypothetical protein